jgi:carboxylesterase type B
MPCGGSTVQVCPESVEGFKSSRETKPIRELARFENSQNVKMKWRRLISSVACSSFAREESNFSFLGFRRRHELPNRIEDCLYLLVVGTDFTRVGLEGRVY